ncbi:MAG: PfkB family carbohydrate kinase [Candidatus Marinimicrobia bacterium]|nr:PfkB family carbohydrate kinase [Candidatus Neomarinimicrobiota bacterium]
MPGFVNSSAVRSSKTMHQIVVVGSIALDSIETPQGKRENALGGSSTYFSLSSSHYVKTCLVGVAGTDFPQSALDLLKKHHIDLEGLDIKEGKTFRWGVRYKNNMNKRDTIYTELNVFENFQPSLPLSYRNSPFLFLGNIHPNLQLQVLNQMNNKPLVALDTMNLWIDISRDSLYNVISKVDILFINEDEIRQLNHTSNVFEAARKTLQHGPKLLIVKRGENGAILFNKETLFIIPAYPVENVVDPTGAGDSFAGGFMGYLATKNPENLTLNDYKMAMVHGTVMASFLVEAFSIERLLTLTPEEITQRVDSFLTMICVN